MLLSDFEDFLIDLIKKSFEKLLNNHGRLGSSKRSAEFDREFKSSVAEKIRRIPENILFPV